MGSARDDLALDASARRGLVDDRRPNFWMTTLNKRILTHWTLPLILVMAALVRLYGVQSSLWLDESASLAFARQPLAHLWGEWMLRETNPPLFYTLLKGWQAVVGSSDAALRLLPLAIGVAGVWAMYWLGRAVGGTRAGLLAAALLAWSAIHVDFSLQLRGYGLAYTGVVFACLGMAQFLRDRRAHWLVLYLGGAAVALYGHTTLALFVALANGAMIVLLRRDGARLLQWLAVNAVLALIWAWWAWMTLRQLGQPHNFGWIGTPSLLDAWTMTSVALAPFYQRSVTIGGTAILVGMLGGAAAFAVKARRSEVTLLAIIAIGAPILLFVVSQKTPVLLPRTLLWAGAPLIALVSAAIVDMSDRRLAGTVAGALLLASVVGTVGWYADGDQEHWDAVARTLDSEASGRPILVTDNAVALALAHYLPDAEGRIVVVDDPAQPHEHWSVGLFGGRHLTPAGATAWFKAQCHVVGLSRGDYDPSALLRAAGGRDKPIGQRERNPLAALWDCGGARPAR